MKKCLVVFCLVVIATINIAAQTSEAELGRTLYPNILQNPEFVGKYTAIFVTANTSGNSPTFQALVYRQSELYYVLFIGSPSYPLWVWDLEALTGVRYIAGREQVDKANTLWSLKKTERTIHIEYVSGADIVSIILTR